MTNQTLHNKLVDIIESKIAAGHIIPVNVTGGRKFKGKGYLVNIIENDDTYDREWGYFGRSYRVQTGYASVCARIWDPTTMTFKYASYKFCELDDTVSDSTTESVETELKTYIVNETLTYCRSKLGDDALLVDVQLYAKRCLAKRYNKVFINPDEVIQIDPESLREKEFATVLSTIDWAIKLGFGQTKTERIIIRSLAYKHIDYAQHKSAFELKFTLNGWTKFKVMSFDN